MIDLFHLSLAVAGLFTLILGTVHFFFPVLLDFKAALPTGGDLAPLKPFRLGPIRYATRRSDVHGIAWVMNYAASYVLISIGIVDLWQSSHPPGNLPRMLLLWIAGWWFLRAGSQLYLGRRRGDYLILVGFAALGLLHLLAAFV